MLDSERTNEVFAKAADGIVEVPHVFEQFQVLHWSDIIENIYVILEAKMMKKFEELEKK